jgi:hypothetical protein
VRHRRLDASLIAATIDRLCQRVEVRFPGSGLLGVCRELDAIADRATETSAWIGRPILPLRIGAWLLVALILAGLAVTLAALRAPVEPLTLGDLVQAIEAAVNDLVFVAIAVFFLLTLEKRLKRRRALDAIQELRSIAHVIDMHQLTKAPEWVLDPGRSEVVAPARAMTRFELSRYLDYCSEALSLTGKIAALYIQGFDDSVALQAVNEVEDLTTGLSRKIWQKLTILYSMGEGA